MDYETEKQNLNKFMYIKVFHYIILKLLILNIVLACLNRDKTLIF